jgi:Outer membrane efflux protein
MPLHYNGGLMISLEWVEGSFSLSRLLLILPMPAGSVESIDTIGYAPAVQTTNCVRLIWASWNYGTSVSWQRYPWRSLQAQPIRDPSSGYFRSDLWTIHFAPHSILLTALVQVFLAPACLMGDQGSVSLEKVTQMALARNPSIAAARARWRMASQRIPQEAAWEDPKLNFRSLMGRFVEVPANGFTNQTVSLEQSIPISGRNRSRERAAAAEAVAAFQDLRRQELEVMAKARSTFIQLVRH